MNTYRDTDDSDSMLDEPIGAPMTETGPASPIGKGKSAAAKKRGADRENGLSRHDVIREKRNKVAGLSLRASVLFAKSGMSLKKRMAAIALYREACELRKGDHHVLENGDSDRKNAHKHIDNIIGRCDSMAEFFELHPDMHPADYTSVISDWNNFSINTLCEAFKKRQDDDNRYHVELFDLAFAIRKHLATACRFPSVLKVNDEDKLTLDGKSGPKAEYKNAIIVGADEFVPFKCQRKEVTLACIKEHLAPKTKTVIIGTGYDASLRLTADLAAWVNENNRRVCESPLDVLIMDSEAAIAEFNKRSETFIDQESLMAVIYTSN